MDNLPRLSNLAMRNECVTTMFAKQHHGPDELLTPRMKDMILWCGPTGTVRAVAAFSAPFSDQPVHSVLDALAWLEDAEIMSQGKMKPVKTVLPTDKSSWLPAVAGPTSTESQSASNLDGPYLAATIATDKIDSIP